MDGAGCRFATRAGLRPRDLRKLARERAGREALKEDLAQSLDRDHRALTGPRVAAQRCGKVDDGEPLRDRHTYRLRHRRLDAAGDAVAGAHGIDALPQGLAAVAVGVAVVLHSAVVETGGEDRARARRTSRSRV